MPYIALLYFPFLHFCPCPVNGEPPTFVVEPPAVKVVGLNVFKNVNGRMANLVLPCKAAGTPTPSISWFREGSHIDSAFVLADGRLAINVTRNEAPRDGAAYYCVATNRIGPGNTTVASLRSRDVRVSHACEL